MGPNTRHGLVSIHHFVHTSMHSSKTKRHIRTLYLSNDCSTIEDISIFWVRTVCEIRQASYESKHALQPLSDMTFVHTYTHNSKTTGRIQTFCVSNECSTMGDVYSLC